MLALGVPALLVAVWIMGSLWRDGGRLVREQEEDEDSLEYEALYAGDGAAADDVVGAGTR